jgi:hypothetical protein
MFFNGILSAILLKFNYTYLLISRSKIDFYFNVLKDLVNLLK